MDLLHSFCADLFGHKISPPIVDSFVFHCLLSGEHIKVSFALDPFGRYAQTVQKISSGRFRSEGKRWATAIVVVVEGSRYSNAITLSTRRA